MPLKALKELVYGGRTIAEGEEFDTWSPRDERTLVAVKKAERVEKKKAKGAKTDKDEDEARPATPASHKGEPAAKEQKYETRRMTAKDND